MYALAIDAVLESVHGELLYRARASTCRHKVRSELRAQVDFRRERSLPIKSKVFLRAV
jgi:hypothetical protein